MRISSHLTPTYRDWYKDIKSWTLLLSALQERSAVQHCEVLHATLRLVRLVVQHCESLHATLRLVRLVIQHHESLHATLRLVRLVVQHHESLHAMLRLARLAKPRLYCILIRPQNWLTCELTIWLGPGGSLKPTERWTWWCYVSASMVMAGHITIFLKKTNKV